MVAGVMFKDGNGQAMCFLHEKKSSEREREVEIKRETETESEGKKSEKKENSEFLTGFQGLVPIIRVQLYFPR